MFTTNIVPGQGFVPFTVYKRQTRITDSGRAVTGGYKPTEIEFFGMLTSASQKEIDEWKQNGHPITHKIIQYSGVPTAEATDFLKIPNAGQYYVQGVKEPAGMKVTNIYYVEERQDIEKELD